VSELLWKNLMIFVLGVHPLLLCDFFCPPDQFSSVLSFGHHGLGVFPAARGWPDPMRIFPCWLLAQVFLSFKSPISTACFLTQFSVPHFLLLVLPRSEQLAWFSCCAHEQDQVRFSHFVASSFHLPVKSRSIIVLIFHAGLCC
jgi:hypothetical protein